MIFLSARSVPATTTNDGPPPSDTVDINDDAKDTMTIISIAAQMKTIGLFSRPHD